MLTPALEGYYAVDYEELLQGNARGSGRLSREKD
jgi:hypothetical protein